MKSKLDKLDVDILVPVSVDLSKLSNVVKMMLLKKMLGMLRLIPNSKFQFWLGWKCRYFCILYELICAFDNKNKYILIVAKGPTQGLDDTTLTAEAEYSIKFCFLSLHGNGSNSFCC